MPSAGHDLDQLLAAWAQARRLSDADAERIREAIVPTAPALSASWWSEFKSKVRTVIARAATPVPTFAALLGAPLARRARPPRRPAGESCGR